ncbi:MAG: ATP-binding protein [Ruminococcus sp.]|nr:ATP-binding protein [Ruminococcus sp.]
MDIKDLYSSYFDISLLMKPYSDDAEQLSELFAFLDLCFAALSGARGLKGEGIPEAGAGEAHSLTVASRDIAKVLLSGQGRDALSEQAREQIENAFFHLGCRLKKSLARDFVPRFEMVRLKFSLNDFETFAMLLALAPEYDRKYESVFVSLHNNSSDIYATVWLAVKLSGYLFGTPPSAGSELLSGRSPLMRFLCSREVLRRDRCGSSDWLLLSRRVSSFILGSSGIDPELSGFCTLLDASGGQEHIPLREEQYREASGLFLANAFADRGCFVLNLFGPRGVGRSYLAARAAASAGLRLLRVDLARLIDRAGAYPEKHLDMICTETVLLGAAVCFVSDTPDTVSDGEEVMKPSPAAAAADRIAAYAAGLFRFIFWATPEKSSSFAAADAVCAGIELPMLTANERRLFWERSLEGTGMDAASFANRYILTPLYISRACRTARELASAQGTALTEQLLTRGVKQHSVNPLGSYAAKINAVFTWDDLVIGDDQKRRMKMICDQVRYRSVVNEDWGFRKKTPYGRGLCAMFYGSPGTGKTMAVQVMANDLGLDLYRIDLSQLSSKYIGETQKNISALFERARNINAMLFFDEADSMFAKRSEVRDANDRYANADTAFLLQKLEEHEGITILATNYVNNIDDAFKRRIKFMINFVFPDADVRSRLWQTILPASAVTDEALDFEFFAEHFELSGSNIKEILTNAAFLAASEGTGLKNRHIIEAVKLNFSKYGKILTDADFDYLAR